ncbi:MAG: hypothetical protein IJ242_10690 [Clostridia bacterium]|nr:hypothetical protein [Clostridia bacterium]
MKKLIFVLCIIFSLSCFAALAEEESNTISLWQHTFIDEDENGNQVEQTVEITLTTAEPVELTIIQNDVNDGFIGIVSRKGVAPVSIDVYPADVVLHANLKNATEEQRQILIDYMAEQYEEGQYTVDTQTLEDGNVYIGVGVSNIRSVLTVIENIEMELIQAHFEEHFEDLTTEDHAFATEILKGITIK